MPLIALERALGASLEIRRTEQVTALGLQINRFESTQGSSKTSLVIESFVVNATLEICRNREEATLELVATVDRQELDFQASWGILPAGNNISST